MREIKYRGWSKKRQCWVYGYYAVIKEIITNTGIKFGEMHAIFNDDPERWKDPDHAADGCCWNEVLPESVGQYTGLHDATDAEIYEGDMLSNIYMDRPCTVFFDKGAFRMKDEYGDVFVIHPLDNTVMGNQTEGMTW